MPQVPTYGGLQVREQAQTGGFQDAANFTGNARAMQDAGRALTDVGTAADRTVQREAQRAAYDAQAAIQARFLEFQQTYQRERQGEKAKGLVGDVDKWWETVRAEAVKTLDPVSRSLVGNALGQARLQALSQAGHFENQHLEAATDNAWLSAKAVVKSNAAANPFVLVPGRNEQNELVQVTGVEAAIDDLRRKNAEYAVRKGVTEGLEALNLKDTTDLHIQVLEGLARNAPDAAREYFKKYEKQIDGAKHANISQQIDTVGNQAKAQMLGAQLAQQFDYTQTADAQKEIDKLPGSPELRTAVRAELEHRHAVQQSDADKSQAVLTGKVMEMVYNNVSPATIKASIEYQSLRDKSGVMERMVHADNLKASRDVAAMARAEEYKYITQAAAAFELQDPDKLAVMSRDQILLQLPTLGRRWTQELLNKKDSMEKRTPADVKVDREDQLVIMQEMGLDPFKKDKTVEGKAMLATTQSRIERALTTLQSTLKAPMTREQKNALIREEVARSVTVQNGIFPNVTKPIVELTAEEVQNVIIPPEHRVPVMLDPAGKVIDISSGKKGVLRASIQEEMADLYKRSKGRDPRYAPTRENEVRYYLQYRKGAMTTPTIPRTTDVK